jgi:hypothetical protein
MSETPDCWEVLADKMIGWMDPNNAPHDLTAIAVNYRSVAEYLQKSLPPTHERQVALRKLLESYTWAMRIGTGFCPTRESKVNEVNAINFWISEFPDADIPRVIARKFWHVNDSVFLGFRDTVGENTFEHVQAARLLLESRDAAVRACLDMLAEQQKQVLRAVSQSE